MSQYQRKLTMIALIIVVVLSFTWLVVGFNLSWVEVKKNYAEVTINFLVPMQQQNFEKHIKLLPEKPYSNQFDYSITWLNEQVASIKIKEMGQIKGQKIKLFVDKAPTRWLNICKSESVDISFKSKIQILSPQNDFIISSTQPFIVQFNTPMKINQIYKYFECDTVFYIEPCIKKLENGMKYTDETCFIFKPKCPLENNKKYFLSFKKGMPSKGGTLLEEDKFFVLQVDQKPVIKSTYPAHQDRWIGLYPRITVESETPITKAYIFVDGKKYIGQLQDAYHAHFLLDSCLLPETSYQIEFQIQAASGELNEPHSINFSTTSLDKDRLWLEVLCGNESVINCYKGTNKIKTMAASVGEGVCAPQMGTYYLQDKKEVYEDNAHKEGANFLLKISQEFGFQGNIRDAYWNIKVSEKNRIGARMKRKNIILNDEDIKWLYENLPINTMIIIRDKTV